MIISLRFILCFSNFTVVVRATDGSLWTIGMGEYDRNVVCEPTAVLAPHTEEEDKLLEEARCEGREDQFKIPLHVAGPGARLVKGHQRVHLLEDSNPPLPTSPTASKSAPTIRTKVYDVVLHNFESYVLPVDVSVPSEQLPNAELDVQFRIKHFVTGWQHTVMVLEN